MRLDPVHYGFLTAEARRLGVSMAEVVRRIIHERTAPRAAGPYPFTELQPVRARGMAGLPARITTGRCTATAADD